MMKFILAACFVLCIGVVYGQAVSPIIRDIPYVHIRPGCAPRHRWQSVYYSSLASTASGGDTTFYYQCTLFRAKESSCVGGCDSSVSVVTNPFSVSSECECCRPFRVHYIKPKVYCRWVVTLPCGGGFQVLQHQIVDHAIANQHKYLLFGDCDCLPCQSVAGGVAAAEVEIDPKRMRAEGQEAVEEVMTLEQVRDKDQEAATARAPSDFEKAVALRLLSPDTRAKAQEDRARSGCLVEEVAAERNPMKPE